MQPFQISNNAATASAGAAPTLRLSVNPSGEVMMLDGTLAADAPAASRSIPMGSPVESAARLFSDALREEGIEFPGEVVVTTSRQSDGEHVLAAIEGAPIGEILKKCMEESDNYLAESLSLLCWRSLSHTAAGVTFPRMGWRRRTGRRSRFPTTTTFRVRAAAFRARTSLRRAQPWLLSCRNARAPIGSWSPSPIRGKTGTLRYRLGEGGMAGRVQAKTGTLDTVGALSGYVKASSGPRDRVQHHRQSPHMQQRHHPRSDE